MSMLGVRHFARGQAGKQQARLSLSLSPSGASCESGRQEAPGGASRSWRCCCPHGHRNYPAGSGLTG